MRDRLILYSAGFLRSLGVGMAGVLLGIYLAKIGFGTLEVGFVIALGLAGTAAGTLFVSLFADRAGRKSTLLGLSLLALGGGFLVAAGDGFAVIAAGAFLGMLSGAGGDRGAAYSLEQAILPATADDEERTLTYAVYGIVQDVGRALGALLAGAPFLLRAFFRVGDVPSYRLTVGVYALAALASFTLYLFLTKRIETAAAPGPRRVSPPSRKIITKLSALFSLDSLGGAFIPSALLAYWFFRQFGVEEIVLGPLFAAGSLVNALSYLGATWLARRIGLINTMVFTHIPASLLLVALPFAPAFPLAVGIYLLREFLAQMDVPTRQSYIVAIVRPEEHTAVTGITNLTRGATRALAPSLAGYLMAFVSLSAPLFICAGLKISYDLLLFGAFRRVKPPEEA